MDGLSIKTSGGYEINKPVDLVLITCNRVERTRFTVDELYKRLKTPFRLIVVDDMSIDGTIEYLREQEKAGRIHVLEQLDNSNICQAYNRGFEFVESEYFITLQDDITVPELEPCVIQQMIDLMLKYSEAGSIGLRIQRIPNIDWNSGNEDLVPARKAASAYYRIQRKNDVLKLGINPFGNQQWDDVAWVKQVRSKLNKECYWTKNLYADHSRGYCPERGYHVKPRKWGTGIHSRLIQEIERKPYPKIDPKTCVPLPGEKLYR